MSDDQDKCEWVSVSSGTGLPGLSLTKAIKRLCVCVCVLYHKLNEQRPMIYRQSVVPLCSGLIMATGGASSGKKSETLKYERL